MVQYFSEVLVKRFISDCNLPIPFVMDKDKFLYYVELYEEQYSSMTLYKMLCDEIKTLFNGDIDAYFQHYYDVRDKIITDILDSQQYKEFLTADMKQYEMCGELKVIPKGNVYNSENIGKFFLSIDLSSANFQALKFYNGVIVNGCHSYNDFICGYINDSKYMSQSKYTRQVIFGKCNPSRQITIEKFLLSEFYRQFKYSPQYLKLVRVNNDELVFEVTCGAVDDTFEKFIEESINEASSKSKVNVGWKIFKLSAFCLHSQKTKRDRNLYYVLHNIRNKKVTFKEVPLTYHALAYKLYNGIPLIKQDYHFSYEGLDAYIDDDFTIKYINSPLDVSRENI